MSALSPEQLSFLRQQKIPLSSVFDASGMKTADWKLAMKADEKSFAFGVVPCREAGHTLRSRAGHCIQCDHSRISYMLRHDARAFVYIAASYIGKLIKIGSTKSIDARARKIIEDRYGNQTDWEMLSVAKTEKSGKIESEVQSKLLKYAVRGNYIREGKSQECYELFKCDFRDALDALKETLSEGVCIKTKNEARAFHLFNFKF